MVSAMPRSLPVRHITVRRSARTRTAWSLTTQAREQLSRATSNSRLLVQREIQDEFRDALARRSAAVVTGHPFEADTAMGPLVDAAHADTVAAMITEAGRARCARAAAG